jgi:cell division protein FtsA
MQEESIMKNLITGRVFTAIDIGTTKICVIMCTVNEALQLEVLGIGSHPSYGIKKGIIVNIAMTVHALKKALDDACEQAGLPINSATVGISGGHIQSFNSVGVIQIKNNEVSQNDIDNVLESAKAISIPEEREIIHIIPQYFRVDGQDIVDESFGMHGARLEAQVHIVTGSVSSAQNIVKACELAGVTVSDIILEQIASAEAVLSPSEKELGVGILDIGGGTADFAVYKDGKIMHSKVIPIAGNHFTNDLAIGLEIPIYLAEKIKRDYGFVFSADELKKRDPIHIIDEDEHIDTLVAPEKIYNILNARAAELYDFVTDEILKHNLRPLLSSGIVITGGGSLLKGMRELAVDQTKLPVRIGRPHIYYGSPLRGKLPETLQSPLYSTVYGIIMYAIQEGSSKFEQNKDETLSTRIFNRMKSWLYDFL